MPNEHGRKNNNTNNNSIPLLYCPLSTQRASYPKYIKLKNGQTPIPINQHYLGNNTCMVLLSSEQAVSLPPIINDVADALYWLQDVYLPMVLRSTYNVLTYHLLHVCILNEQHIHPSDTQFWLAAINVTHYFETIWAHVMLLIQHQQ
jgi:hypothetical protein